MVRVRGRCASSGATMPRRSARAEDQDVASVDAHAEVVVEVAREADAVGGVPVPAVGVAAQRIHRAGDACALAQRAREREGLALERQRDVEAPAAVGGEALHRRHERVERREQALVRDVLAGLARERGLDQGRLRVRDGIADDGVTIGH